VPDLEGLKVISRKSTSEIVAQVVTDRVVLFPDANELNLILFRTLPPEQTSVLIVWLKNVYVVMPEEAADSVKVANVFDPVIDRVPPPVLVNETLLKVLPCPENIAVGPVKLIVEVPAFTVSSTLKFPLTVIVEAFSVRVFVAPAFARKFLQVTEKFDALVVNVPPRKSKSEPLDNVSAPPRVTVIPEPFTVTGPRVFPAVVNVPVPVIVNPPVYEYVCPATKVTLPATVIVLLPVNVPVNPVKLIDLIEGRVVTVHVIAPDAASKNTSSAEVGTAAPPAPPEVVDHLVKAPLSQKSVPPTQKRFAMLTLLQA
jgi:hypothetical protein